MRIVLVGLVLLWLAVLSGYDIRQRRLPNLLTVPGATAILAAAALAGHGRSALVGAAGLAAVYLAVHLVDTTAMGAGDVKLAIGVGALTGCFGFEVWLLAALGAPLLTLTVATLCRVRTVPHGPSMSFATAAAAGLVLLD
ncbi:peptidase A24 [Mycobacterium asiaticum]|uniref:Peptidase A24 n=1 Tax=Mycobacterium asiaticum TaxID=1790 RepID=A0A1A3NKK8_MYCAS|nr:prepilin peptidase [Mycobacterium asiaticum]OBK20892.1 peptidase A24 [Mycobacterium asiaticum]